MEVDVGVTAEVVELEIAAMKTMVAMTMPWRRSVLT